MRTITLLNLAEVNVRDSFSRAQVPGSPDALLSGGFRSLEPERLHHLSTERPSSDAAPIAGQPANLDHYAWRSDCSGLLHTPTAS